jgi:hypothetical protein
VLLLLLLLRLWLPLVFLLCPLLLLWCQLHLLLLLLVRWACYPCSPPYGPCQCRHPHPAL